LAEKVSLAEKRSRLLLGAHDLAAQEGIRKMRPADAFGTGDPGDFIEIDGDAIAFEEFHDALVPLIPRSCQKGERIQEPGILLVDSQAKKVEFPRIEFDSISTPAMNESERSEARPRASATPATVSWSVRAMAFSPCFFAWPMSSEGEKLPSEAVEWV